MISRYLGCLLALMLSATALAAPDQRAPAEPPSSDTVLRATLNNGLRVVVVPDHLAPVVTTELCYLAGSNDAPDGFPGTAHALEHMMFRGSEGLDKDQLYELGARLGGRYNASTAETVTHYTYTVSPADLSLVLRIEALRMQKLLLAQTDWEQERGAIEQEVARDLSSPIYDYYTRVRAVLFDGTPYAHDALGTRESFDRTDAAMLRTFYDQWYVPNNAILVIAGDVSPAKVLAEVKARFDDIPARPVPDHPAIALRPFQPRTLTLPTDFPFGVVALAYRMPGMKSADFAAADILSDVLSSQRGALYGLVPAGRVLGANFSYRANADTGLGFAYVSFPDGADPAGPRADVEQVIADIVRKGVPPELVEAAKRKEIAELGFRNDSIAGLAGSWADTLTMTGAQSPDDLAKAYDAVTVDDVNRVARSVLDPDRVVTSILTPVHGGQPAAGAGYGAPETIGAVPADPVTLPNWADAALAIPAPPEAVRQPDVSVLPNGIRLIVQPEHVSHTVSVFGRVRQVSAIQEPPGKEGVAMITAHLFGYGSQAHDRLALRAAVDDLAASEAAGPSFHLSVLAPNFEAGMKLLAENELHPALPADGFDVVQRQMAQSLPGMLRSPGHLFSRAVDRALLPGDDPALREETPESVAGITLDDVKAFYQAAYRPDLTTIVIIGDISVAEARRVVADTFGGWHADGPTPRIDLPAVADSHASRAFVADPSNIQASATLTETLSLPVTSPDRFALVLGNTILGSGFSSRLYQDLRVHSGTVYTVRSDLDWDRTRGEYEVTFGADPDKVDTARDTVLRDLKAMQASPVSDAELARAKAQILRELRMDDASVQAIAGRYLYRDSVGLPLASQQADGKRYLGLTARDVQKAFETWIRPDDLATVVKGPAPGQ